MKQLISLIVLVQVGSNLLINPAFVVGVKTNTSFCSGSEILLNSGTDMGAHSFVCSDWTPAQIAVVLTGKVPEVK